MIPNVRGTLNSVEESYADIKGNQALFPSIAEPVKRHRAKIMALRDRFEVENDTQNVDHSEAAQRAALKGDRALLRLLEDGAWQNSQTNQYPRCSICTDELPLSFYV
jgi:NAD-dependent SIR2 family protein deacetylase